MKKNVNNIRQFPNKNMPKNEELLKLLKEYKSESNVEKLNTLVSELVKCTIFVPAMVNADKKPVPKLMKAPDGKMFLGIYTDRDQVPESERKDSLLVMPYLMANNVVMFSENQIQGVVLNPFSDNLVLKKELVVRIDEVEKRKAELKNNSNPTAKMSPDGKSMAMTEREYNQFERTQFEVGYLPGKLFAEGQAFIDKLIKEKENYIDEMYEDSYKEKRMYPLLPEDFSVMPLSLSDDLTVIRVDMPEKDVAFGNAYRVYICFNKATNEARYFRIAQGKEKSEVYLEEVTKDKKYIRVQEAPVEGTELSTITELIGYNSNVE